MKKSTLISINSILIGFMSAHIVMDFGFDVFLKYGIPFIVLMVSNLYSLLSLMEKSEKKD